MSHYMTALAMRQTGIKPATKIVLYFLADHHNESTDDCFPSLNTLAARCEMSRATVVRHLDDLEKARLIERIERFRDNGSQTSTLYKLRLTPVSELNSPCIKMKQPPVSKRDPHNLGNLNLGNEQSLFGSDSQQSSLQRTDTNNTQNAEHEDSFQQFWKVYPRKVAPGNARKAWKGAIKKAKPDQIIAGAEAYAKHCDIQRTEATYIAHPATWLNGERWSDHAPAPVDNAERIRVLLANAAIDRDLGNPGGAREYERQARELGWRP